VSVVRKTGTHALVVGSADLQVRVSQFPNSNGFSRGKEAAKS